MNTLIKALIAAIVLSGPLMLNAETNGHYRWVDDQGNVKYSDRPPAGVEAEFIKFAASRTSKASNQSAAENSETPSKSTPTAQIPEKLEVMQAKDPKLCAQAKQNLKALDGARIRITEPDGSQRFLSEEEKEDQRDNARKFMDINC